MWTTTTTQWEIITRCWLKLWIRLFLTKKWLLLLFYGNEKVVTQSVCWKPNVVMMPIFGFQIILSLGALKIINSLCPSNAIWRHRSGSLAQVIWFVAWRHQAITWTNVDLSSVRIGDIYLKAISQGMSWPLITKISFNITLWRHQMEAFSALLALGAGNSPVTGEFPSQRPVTRSFGVFLWSGPEQTLSKQNRLKRRWFETPSCSLWRHCNDLSKMLFKSQNHWVRITSSACSHDKTATKKYCALQWCECPITNITRDQRQLWKANSNNAKKSHYSVYTTSLKSCTRLGCVLLWSCSNQIDKAHFIMTNCFVSSRGWWESSKAILTVPSTTLTACRRGCARRLWKSLHTTRRYPAKRDLSAMRKHGG